MTPRFYVVPFRNRAEIVTGKVTLSNHSRRRTVNVVLMRLEAVILVGAH